MIGAILRPLLFREEPYLSQPAIVIEGVTKRFRDKVAVDRLDLVVQSGSLCGFLGPNGAGKTTTIRMIMSIFYPDEGSIRVLGRDSAIESKDRIGYLPEERGIYRKMRMGEFLKYAARLKGMPRAGLENRVRAWLERVGLGDCYKKKCEELSKGMQQKAQFIAAVIHEPELLILDEPFSGLDPVNRRLLRSLINEQREKGHTVIFSTHAMFEAEQLCDHLFMIDRGKKVLDQTIEDVWRTHDPRSVIVDPVERDSALAAVRSVPGIESVHATTKGIEARLAQDANPQQIIARIVQGVPVRRVELKRPTLEDIFLELVGASSEDGSPAAELLRQREEALQEAANA